MKMDVIPPLRNNTVDTAVIPAGIAGIQIAGMHTTPAVHGA